VLLLSCFSSHPHPRHPGPSLFPTRRSSDLKKTAASTTSKAPTSPASSRSPTPCWLRVWCKQRHASSQALQEKPLSEPSVGAFCRSEEHTSELQSRENLVCRLLLEKKKRSN